MFDPESRQECLWLQKSIHAYWLICLSRLAVRSNHQDLLELVINHRVSVVDQASDLAVIDLCMQNLQNFFQFHLFQCILALQVKLCMNNKLDHSLRPRDAGQI